MAKKKLPQKVFMAWNYDSPNDPFLDHSDEADLLAEKGSTITVGLYELKRKVKLVNKTTVE